jgi:lipoate-protein ligase A
MHYLERVLPVAVDNVALEEALLLEAEAGQGGEVLRVWEYPAPVVVLGSACILREEVHEDNCRHDGVEILRRSSGGGTVLWGPGCLLYSLVLRYDRHPLLEDLRGSYRFILERILAALDLPGAEQAGISDLALGGRKFSGNAQQRKRHHLLHHGTLLYGFDLDLAGRYLKLPPRRPEYRRDRDHRDFIGNIARSADWMRQRLRETWQADEDRTDWPEDRVRQLVAERFGTREWIYRR